jgi:UDP-N-acetylmuramoyl-L-alanyl-D-glutamate--2,6-diaminopimelate ligase
MKLSALIAALPPGSVVASQTADTELPVTGLTADSRVVEPGNLFFALAGVKTDGARFAAQAASRGAVAIVAALNSELPDIGFRCCGRRIRDRRWRAWRLPSSDRSPV